MAATLATTKVTDGAGAPVAGGGARSIDESGTGAGPFRAVAALVDGAGVSNVATISQFHNADNQQPGTTAWGLLTGGVAQELNAAGNLDRQRATGADQIPGRGIVTGAAQFAQEVLATSTTSVTAAAATATLSIANTAGFQVGGTLNFEPSLTGAMAVRYESATITAVVANTSVTVAFPPGGALFTHTQPYVIQSFLYNQERDFLGEQQCAQGIGAAIATEFESNSGGPPLSGGLPSMWTLDADRNIQGKNNAQLAISSTTAGNTSVVFTNNPWINGLVIGQVLILSATANGAAVEAVIVSKNNTPAVGAGPITVNIVNPVVTSGSTFATFDAYGLNVPATVTPMGTEDTLIWLFDPLATDPKRPLLPMAKAQGTIGALDARGGGRSSSLNITASAVVKASPGRAIRVTVQTTTATAAITLNDVTTTGGAAAANAFHTIPSGTTAGTVYFLDWPCLVGIVAAFGTATGALAIAFD